MFKKLLYFVSAIIFIAVFISSDLYGAERTWDGGGGGDNNWNTAANWDAAVNADDALTFAGLTQTTNNNDFAGGTSFGLITFNAGGFTVGGNSVTLTSGINNTTGTNVFNCGISLNNVSQEFTVGGTSLTLGGAISVGNATLTINSSGTSQINGVISGTGAVTKSGVGTTTLSGANTYTGATTVSTGSLKYGASNVLSNSSAVTVSGGTLDIVSYDDTVAAVTLTSGAITGTSGVLTGSSYAVESGTISAILAGGGALTKTTAGTITLSGTNTYTGGTTISAGSLQYGASNVLSDTTAVSVSSGAVLDLAGYNDTIGSLAGEGNVTFGSGSLTAGGVGGNTNYSGIMSGTGSFTKAGSGTVTLSGANTYSGGTTISAGSLQYGASNVLANAGAIAVSGGGTLNIVSYDDTVAAVTLTSGAITGTSGVLTGSSYAVESGTISAILAGGGALTKTTAGTVTLSGTNTYTGGTTISAGSLQYGASNVLSNSSAVTVSGGTLDIVGYDDTVAAVTLTSGDIVGTTGVLTGSSYAVESGTIGAILAGGGALTKTTAGTVTLVGENTYSGGTTVSGGTLETTVTGGLQGDITNNATVEFIDVMVSITCSSIISGTGVVIKSAFGETTISGQNTYSGGTLVSGGILKGTTTSLQGDITNNATVKFSQMGGGTYSSVISGSGALIKSDIGTVTLSGANTYTGATTVSAGSLKYGASNVLSNSSAITVSGGTLDIVNYDDTVAAVTLTSGAITGTSGVLTGSSYAVESGTISAILAGVGALTKTAAGTVTLSGANTYSGATTIDIGTLSVTGTIADSAVAINSGGTLIGSGTVGDVVVASGGTFSPGLSPGTLNSGAAVWESGGTYLWEINKATGLKGAPLGLGWDWLDITGGLSITATSGSKFNLDLSTMEVDASNFNNLQDYLWVIATASTGITSFSADKFDIDSALFTNALGGGAFGISQSGNDINLTFTAVPEPSTYALFGIGLLGLLGGWIRKKAVRTI